jgi:phosphoenolpyruvate-protein phosphotransferase
VTDQDIFRGTAVSTGIAQGAAYVLTFAADHAAVPCRGIGPDEVEGEIARLEVALDKAERDLLALSKDVAARVGSDEAEVFTAQALVARDHVFLGQVVSIVRDHRVNVEAAVAEVVEKFTRTFDQITDPYLRERAADVRDVGRRLLGALTQSAGFDPSAIPEGSILVVDELLPSAAALLDLGRVRALVSDRGGKFSHTSILARSMRLPAVTGLPDVTLGIKTGDALIVDGISGVVFVNPGESVLREYTRLEGELRGYREDLHKIVDLPAITLDGTQIGLLANASKLSDTEAACLYKADGIGLYRTEFGFSVRAAFPSEEDQYEILERAAARIHPRKIVLRLLDVGGDKELPYMPLPASRNPALGQRGVRLLLRHPEILLGQLRAFLRVSADHPVSILLPVVGGLDEVRAVRGVIARAMEALTAEGKRFNPEIPVGAMIEVPSAAVLAGALAREVDFLSLGTNDLVQYVLAADRENETVADQYRPHHPAVLHLIESVATAARLAHCPLTICGEMAGDPEYTELLIGLGLRTFSVAPGEMLEVKNAIRAITLEAAAALAREVVGLGSVIEVEAALERRRRVAPGPTPAVPALARSTT